MLEFENKYDFINIVLIQATLPFLETQDLDKGFQLFEDSKIDSVISVVRQKRFYWKIENRAFFIASRDNLLKKKVGK